jgi:hypothetical protein
MAQPELPPAAPLELERAEAEYSPVEIAVRLGLGPHGRISTAIATYATVVASAGGPHDNGKPATV